MARYTVEVLEEHPLDTANQFSILADRTDETARVQAVFDAAAGGGFSSIEWPTGVIRISSTIKVRLQRGVTVRGTGKTGGWPALPWSLSNLGGTIFEWAGPEGGTMFDIGNSRFFSWSDMSFSTQLADRVGDSAGVALSFPSPSVFGDGQMDLERCSFQLSGDATGMLFGSGPDSRNAADLKASRCVFWGDPVTGDIGLVDSRIKEPRETL